MSNTDISWRWDLVVFRLCNQNPTLSQRQIDVKYWRQHDFHFQPKCNVCLTSCPTSTWRYIDVWCLLGLFLRVCSLCFAHILEDDALRRSSDEEPKAAPVLTNSTCSFPGFSEWAKSQNIIRCFPKDQRMFSCLSLEDKTAARLILYLFLPVSETWLP